MISRTRLLGGSGAFLLLVLAMEWLWPAGSAAPGPASATHVFTPARPAAALARETSGWATTILARPLFSISRRPPRVVAGAHAETAAGQARLSGIMISRANRRAIFAPDGGGKPLVLAEGATIDDSIIRSIEPDRVILASGTVLRPTYDHNHSAAVTTTPPFQPVMPNFATPGFANPGFPPNAFANPGVQPQGYNPVQPPPEDGVPMPPAALPPGMQNPAFRGALMPQRRE